MFSVRPFVYLFVTLKPPCLMKHFGKDILLTITKDRRRRQRCRAQVAVLHSHLQASMAAGRPMLPFYVTRATPEDGQ